jgi:hypothetical protein
MQWTNKLAEISQAQETNALAYQSVERTIKKKQIYEIDTNGACIIKVITAVICGFRNKLECLSLASLSSLV